MNEFAEDRLESLTPGDQAYEIRIEDDFAFRVLPNGSKTWVFVHTKEGIVRRHTLGVYPATDIEQARRALQAVRGEAVGKAPDPPRTEVPESRTPNRPQVMNPGSWVRSKAGLALTVAALSISGLWTLQANEYLFSVSPGGMQTGTRQSQVETTADSNHPGPVGRAEAVVVTDRVSGGTGPLPGPGEADLRTGTADSDPALPPVTGESSPERPVSMPETPALFLRPVSVASESSIADNSSKSKVKRAQFTTGIVDREPVDRIGPVWTGWQQGQDDQQIYFFTELGGMNGRTVYHRWALNGETVSEIGFEIGSSWRWRVFSSKTVAPDLRGR